MGKSWAPLLLLLLFSLPAGAQTPEPAPKEKPDAPVPADSITKSPSEKQIYVPISGTKRLEWFFVRSAGPESLVAGAFTAGIGTARDKPFEYGPHWDGFSKRYGMRFTGIATSNAIEAGLGAVWGEDPRYFRATGRPFLGRVRNVLVLTVVARRRNGKYAPSYARFVAIPGSNFLSNTWRADSEANASSALTRTALGFLGHLVDNAFQEFWPEFKKHTGPLGKNVPIGD
jgi:hypothetical protein